MTLSCKCPHSQRKTNDVNRKGKLLKHFYRCWLKWLAQEFIKKRKVLKERFKIYISNNDD
jgi:hypothetical protein